MCSAAPDLPILLLPSFSLEPLSCCFLHQPENPCPVSKRDLSFVQTCLEVVVLDGDSGNICGFISFALGFG